MKNIVGTIFFMYVFLLLFSCKNATTEKFTVTYKVYDDGWIDMTSEQIAKGGAFDANKVPVNVKIEYSGKEYSFAGWTAKDLSPANPSTATGELYSGQVTSNMTVYAVYRQDESSSDGKFIVTYKVYDDGWMDMTSEQVEKGGNFDDAKIPDNAKIDYSGRKYSFAGWTAKDLSSANPSTATGQSYSGAVVADMTVYAVYQVHPYVTYKYWNGTEWAQLGEVQTVEPNSPFDDSKAPAFDVIKCNMESTVTTGKYYDYAFQFNKDGGVNHWANTGWTSSDEATKTASDTVSATALSASDKVTGDMTVYAMYKKIDDFIYVEKGDAKKDSAGTNKLSIDYDFLICDHEVTQAEYKAYTEAIHTTHTSGFTGDNLPVEKVSWYDAVEYCNWLSEQDGLDPYYTINKIKDSDTNNLNTSDTKKWLVTVNENANGYRLPLEWEWEYAARGGKKGNGYKYSGSNTTCSDVAWYIDNSSSTTHDVRGKKPNELGLYDMSGNVEELCWDWHDGSGMTLGGPASSSGRVVRGGCWSGQAIYCEVSYRDNPPDKSNPDLSYEFLGFRVTRNAN